MSIRIHPNKAVQRLSVLLAVSLVLAACGASDTSSPEITNQAPESTEVGSEVGSELDPSDASNSDDGTDETTTTSPSTTTTEVTTTTTEAADAGSPLDFFPPIGTEFSVVGVRWDDDLNFRSGPGTSNPVLANVASLDTASSIVGLGQAWQFDDSIWWKVDVDGIEAWASARFLAAPGLEDDIFDEVAQELMVLKSANLTELAQRVADSRPTGGPEPRVVVVGEPLIIEGPVGLITIDVLDFGDDAIKGERLWISAALIMSADAEVDAVVLEGVTRTFLCGRGVDQGFCL